MLVAAALAVGVVVGVLSGLTGIGGGVLMVPFLYLLYARLAVPAADATVLAHATSLTVIVPTALRGLHGYRGLGLVRWREAMILGAAAAVSAALSARVAVHVPAHALRTGFGLFLVVVALDLLRHRERPAAAPLEARASMVYAALLGLPIGALSAFLGVGGGIVATIGMYYVLHIRFESVPPTSLAVIAVTATAGSLSYLFTAPVAPLPFGGVVGLVDFQHALPLAAGSVLAAPFGVRLNRRLPVASLRRFFAVFLLLIGLDIVWENLLR